MNTLINIYVPPSVALWCAKWRPLEHRYTLSPGPFPGASAGARAAWLLWHEGGLREARGGALKRAAEALWLTRGAGRHTPGHHSVNVGHRVPREVALALADFAEDEEKGTTWGEGARWLLCLTTAGALVPRKRGTWGR